MIFFRSLTTFSALFLFLAATDPRKLRVRLKDLWCFAGSGICSIVFFNFCYFQAIRIASLSVAATLLYTAPMFVAVLSAVLFRERITARKTAALGLAFLGCALVSGVFGGPVSVPVPALLFGLGSGFGYALYSIFGRYALRRYDFLAVAAYTFLFASAGCLPLLDFSSLLRVVSAPDLFGLTVLSGAVTSAVPYVLYTYGLGHVEPSRASVTASVEPAASLIGIVFYHEAVSAVSLAGSALVLAAVILLNRKPRRAAEKCAADPRGRT